MFHVTWMFKLEINLTKVRSLFEKMSVNLNFCPPGASLAQKWANYIFLYCERLRQGILMKFSAFCRKMNDLHAHVSFVLIG